VSQDVSLFYGTLKENIALGAPFADDQDILAAAEIAGVTEFANRHPEGFDMAIGERGESLSGGQRQAVGIARAVLNDSPMLLLDEPSSAMDHQSEDALKSRLRRFTTGKTMILVTHRTSLLELIDRLIVIDNGQIVARRAQGTSCGSASKRTYREGIMMNPASTSHPDNIYSLGQVLRSKLTRPGQIDACGYRQTERIGQRLRRQCRLGHCRANTQAPAFWCG